MNKSKLDPLKVRQKMSPLLIKTCALIGILSLAAIFCRAFSQEAANVSDTLAVKGIVLSAQGLPVNAATVRLRRSDTQKLQDAMTNEIGEFNFVVSRGAVYSLIAEKSGLRSIVSSFPSTTSEAPFNVKLVLSQKETSSNSNKQSVGGGIQFADQPDFTVAGVTDFTAAGGHGSDSSLRTSEALAARTLMLKAEATGKSDSPSENNDLAFLGSEASLEEALAKAPESFATNHRLGEVYRKAGKYQEAIPLLEKAYQIDKANRENEYDLALTCKALGDPAHARKYVQELLGHGESADLYRLAAELDEAVGDSLAAVHEYQKAVSIDASEQNLFAWGSDLLTHRAIWQARQVFEQGAKQYPASSRMLTGLGTALFAGAAYEEAATKLCSASDLNLSDREPYLFMGRVQIAAPNRLDCVEQRLQRFVQHQPADAEAKYLYAMAIKKRRGPSGDPETVQEIESLLDSAVTIDPKYAEAYLQLGIICATRGDFTHAILQYQKAIGADAKLSDAYYRLAVAYDRTGEALKAKEAFKLHDEIASEQAVEADRQRQEVKQFVILLPSQQIPAQTP